MERIVVLSRRLIVWLALVIAAVLIAAPALATAADWGTDPVPNLEIRNFTFGGIDYAISPYGAAFDAAGNIYVSDNNNHCIWKFAPDGTALDAWGSSFGSDHPMIGSPYGLAFDAAGYLYVADYAGYVIKMDSEGHEVDFFTDPAAPTGYRPSTCCGEDIVMDSLGRAYVADDDSVVCYFDPTDYASALSQEYWTGGFFLEDIDPTYGVALDGAGGVYVASSGWGTAVRKYLASDASLDTSWGDGGIATVGGYDGTNPNYTDPKHIRFDADGNLLVQDRGTSTIVVLGPDGTYLTHFPQNPDDGAAIPQSLSSPWGMATMGDMLLVCDTGNGRVLGYNIASDDVAPETTVVSASTGWVGSGSFTLSATDDRSGVEATYYTIDGGTQETYTDTVTVTDAGVHEVAFWSVDKAGNAESAETLELWVDRTTPVTVASGAASYDGVAVVDLDATDAESGVADTFYQFLGDPADEWTSGDQVTCTTPGTYTVLYYSVDAAGNTERTQQFAFTLRGTTDFALSGPAAVQRGGTVQLFVDMNMGQATGTHDVTIQSSADGTTWTDCGACDAPFSRCGDTFSIAQTGSTYYRAVFAGDTDHSPMVTPALLVTSTPASSRLSFVSSVSWIRRGGAFRFRGTLSPADPGDMVSFYVRKPGKRTYVRVATVPASGAYRYRYAPRVRGTYYVYAKFAGSATHLPVKSRTLVFRVK